MRNVLTGAIIGVLAHLIWEASYIIGTSSIGVEYHWQTAQHIEVINRLSSTATAGACFGISILLAGAYWIWDIIASR